MKNWRGFQKAEKKYHFNSEGRKHEKNWSIEVLNEENLRWILLFIVYCLPFWSAFEKELMFLLIDVFPQTTIEEKRPIMKEEKWNQIKINSWLKQFFDKVKNYKMTSKFLLEGILLFAIGLVGIIGNMVTIYNLQFTIYKLLFTIYKLLFTIYNLQVIIYNLQFTIYNSQFTIFWNLNWICLFRPQSSSFTNEFGFRRTSTLSWSASLFSTW